MTETLLGLVLTRLDRIEAPILRHREIEVFPTEELKMLLADGILRETSKATEIPRPAHLPPGPDLVVRQTARGLYGVAADDDYFDPIPLTEDDVRQYEVVISKLANRIRRDNNLHGSLRNYGGTLFALGEITIPNLATVAVFLSLRNTDETDILSICRRVRQPIGKSVFVLVPYPIPLSVENRQLLGSWNIFVIPLIDHVTAACWTIPWNDLLRLPGEVKTPPADSYCRVITHEGTRYLKQREYEKLVGRRGKFDMLIDGVTKQATVRTSDGEILSNTLTAGEFAVISEYIESNKIMRPTATKSCGLRTRETMLKLFEGARRKVDIRLDRYKWRAFRLHKATDPEFHAFEFAPPESMTYCLIIPIQG